MATALKLPTGNRALSEYAARARARATSLYAKAREKTEQAMQFAVGVGIAAAVGYWLGKTDEDQWFNIDKEIIIGGALAAIGLSGLGGKQMTGVGLAGGATVLGAWAFNKAKAKAEEG